MLRRKLVSVVPNHYFSVSYNSKGRFCSYWHQIDEIISLKPSSVLEIGIGNKFVSNYLKEYGVNVVTFDIDIRLNPNIVGSVLFLPFAENSFDVIVCYEVLEHIPYKYFRKALFEIYRVVNSKVVISLPDIERCYKIHFKFLKRVEVKKYIEVPRRNKPIHKFDGEHYWEIGKQGYSLNRICQEIVESGFRIKRTYRVFENTYHRFFVLEKAKERFNGTLILGNLRLGNSEDWRKNFEERLTFKKICRYLHLMVINFIKFM